MTMRKVAAAANCSTMMLYTLFGGKDQLVESVYRDGFERLAAALAPGTHEADPLERLRELARAYRRFGLANRTLYAAMFSQPIVTPRLRGTEARRGTQSFETLLNAVRSARDCGALDDSRPSQIVADSLWSAVHGHVSLEISGHFTDDPPAANMRFEALVAMCLTGLSRPSLRERLS